MSANMSEGADGAHTRLVVVEDDESIRELLAAGLRFAHYDVRTVANGADALAVCRASDRNIDPSDGDISSGAASPRFWRPTG